MKGIILAAGRGSRMGSLTSDQPKCLTELGGKPTVLATITEDLIAGRGLHAGDLVKALAEAVGGRGGGRPNMAQAGLPDADALRRALAAAPDIVREFAG